MSRTFRPITQPNKTQSAEGNGEQSSKANNKAGNKFNFSNKK